MFRLSRLLFTVPLSLVFGIAVTGGSHSLAADPQGNNGTVKVDAKPFDALTDNEPHPSGEFQVDFHGFDEGTLWATATFTVISPTTPSDVVAYTSPPIFIG